MLLANVQIDQLWCFVFSQGAMQINSMQKIWPLFQMHPEEFPSRHSMLNLRTKQDQDLPF